MHILTDPFQYIFIQRALLAAIIVGVLCASLGTFIVLRRMSVVGHALTHSALPGLVIAYLLGVNVLAGAVVATLLTAFGIGFLSKDETMYEDTLIGMIPNMMFALGILLISTSRSYRDMMSMLFGNILGITDGDMAFIFGVALCTILVIIIFFKELKLFCVDINYAKAIGLPVQWIRYGLLFFLSLTVVVGIQAVGTTLTNALLVIPVATARLLTKRLGWMMVLSCISAVSSAVIGVFISYYFNVSSGAAIVLTCAFFFCMAWIVKWKRN